MPALSQSLFTHYFTIIFTMLIKTLLIPCAVWCLSSMQTFGQPNHNTSESTYTESDTAIVVDVNQKAQTLEGWGVSLCWWAHECGAWSDARIDTLVDWLVSPQGLNYNIFRYNIGGGDDPHNRHCDLHHMGRGKGLRAEMPGFMADSAAAYDWEADSTQLRILRRIHQRRPDAIFEAFSNSAPWFMTQSGCCAGNEKGTQDNLRPDCYEPFAHYLVDVCRHISDRYGITFRTLEPFNESHSDYWYRNGSQEGCHFDTPSQVAFIRCLYPILQQSGLPTVISASDETSTAHSLEVFAGYDEVLPLIGQWNVHTYSATADERRALHRLTSERGIRLWQSESGDGGRGLSGNLKMLQRMFDDLRDLQPVAWCDWQYVEEGNDQWCLVRGDFRGQRFERIPNYYVRQQVTRFIGQGYTMLRTSDPHTLAALSPEADRLVIVALHRRREPRSMVFTLPQGSGAEVESYVTTPHRLMERSDVRLAAPGRLEVEMEPLSVRTFVIRLAR